MRRIKVWSCYAPEVTIEVPDDATEEEIIRLASEARSKAKEDATKK